MNTNVINYTRPWRRLLLKYVLDKALEFYCFRNYFLTLILITNKLNDNEYIKRIIEYFKEFFVYLYDSNWYMKSQKIRNEY